MESELKNKTDKLIVQRDGVNALVVGKDEASESQTRVKVRIDNQGRIVIPSFVREDLKITPNDTFWLAADNKGISLKKIESKTLTPIRTLPTRDG